MPKRRAAPPTPPPSRAQSPAVVNRGRGQPQHQPTQKDRDTVSLMVAGGITQADIARTRGIGLRTLQKHYKTELATGATAINAIVIVEHVKQIKAGNFNAIKWWQQARMGWHEHIVVDDGKPADTPMRVIVEFVGEAPAVPQVEQSAPASGSRLSDLRKNVQLVG